MAFLVEQPLRSCTLAYVFQGEGYFVYFCRPRFTHLDALLGVETPQTAVITFTIESAAVSASGHNTQKFSPRDFTCSPGLPPPDVRSTGKSPGCYLEMASNILKAMYRWVLTEKSSRTRRPFTSSTSDSDTKFTSGTPHSQPRRRNFGLNPVLNIMIPAFVTISRINVPPCRFKRPGISPPTHLLLYDQDSVLQSIEPISKV